MAAKNFSKDMLAPTVLAASLAATPAAALSIYTDRSAFEAALGAVTVIDFNDFPGQPVSFDGSSVDVGPFTLTGDPTDFAGLTNFISNQVSAFVCTTAVCRLDSGYRFSFDTAIRGFGADYTDAFTSQGISFTVNGTTFDGPRTPPGTGFFGFVDTSPFSDIDVSGMNEAVLFDNVTFGTDVTAAVPEPATWAMMLIAAGMAGAALRRHRPAPLGQAG